MGPDWYFVEEDGNELFDQEAATEIIRRRKLGLLGGERMGPHEGEMEDDEEEFKRYCEKNGIEYVEPKD